MDRVLKWAIKIICNNTLIIKGKEVVSDTPKRNIFNILLIEILCTSNRILKIVYKVTKMQQYKMIILLITLILKIPKIISIHLYFKNKNI